MKRKEFWVSFWMWISISGVFFNYGKSPVNFETGKIIEKVVCRTDPQQSYALYLPPGYSVDKKWPIIYAFDPGAQGPVPLRHFKAAAGKYGYIIVGSNNSRNGPWEPIYQAGRAMWLDTRERFSIDDNRVYAAGFSGGSRAASTFQYIIKRPAAGIIGCGAGLDVNLKPGMIKSALYYGMIGLADFNYREMMRLDKDLDAADVEHRVLVFDGGHQWPPEEYCLQALEWMEINAIKKGLKQKDEQLVADLYKKTLDRAQNLELSKNIFFVVSAYQSAQQLFNGLVDITKLENKTRQLAESREYKTFQKKEQRRNKKEADFIGIFARVTERLKNSNLVDIPGQAVLFRDLKIRYLQEEANKADIYDRALAQRLLTELRIHTFRDGTGYLQKGDFHRAGIFLEIAARAGDYRPNIIYNQACVYSRVKNKKKALNYLKQAIKKGFNDFELLKKDKDLDFIRNEKEFQEIIKQLKKDRQ
ncbi:MAG: hypothetical protein JSV88_14635 [Candidatus Aminicenantes bacterium]|nr:MAG: hypothetical protein JSV88_14635 [Candidatus Aminicenantes bacterium]